MTLATRPTTPPTGATPRQRTAQRITDILEPKNVTLVLIALIGGINHGLPGLGWALIAALFCAVIPVLFITHGVRRGRWSDRHVGKRKQRLTVIPWVMASVVSGLLLMVLAGSPREMTAMVLAMLTTLSAVLAITAAWKISAHTAVSSGAIAMLATALGPWWLMACPLVPLIGWSRVTLDDHTTAQTVVGALVGALTAGAAFAVLR
ncbi:hypothetical protein ACWDFH_07355 [Streptomyces kronopolitis]